jgi:acyl phosphate:glycerol-3-phosphate acyltransferase
VSDWAPYLLAAVLGYLIGSIQPARIVFARLRPGTEPDLIRTPTTDGEAELVARAVGATNVMIAFGPRWGMLTMALDALKAFVPTLALLLAFPDESYHLVCAVAVLVGHLWSVWYSFGGGGGNSSIMGMMLAISPIGLVVTHVGGMLIGKVAPMFAFLGGVALTIPWFAWRDGIYSPEVLFAIAITVLYLLPQLTQVADIRRFKREGHELDVEHVMRLMKGSAATGKTGAELAAETSAARRDEPAERE